LLAKHALLLLLQLLLLLLLLLHLVLLLLLLLLLLHLVLLLARCWASWSGGLLGRVQRLMPLLLLLLLVSPPAAANGVATSLLYAVFTPPICPIPPILLPTTLTIALSTSAATATTAA
jgi:hypothetical protein